MRMKATGIKSERETIIVLDEEGKLATLWTASDSIYRQMKKRGWIPIDEGERHALFQFPKNRLRLPRMPSRRGFGNKRYDISNPVKTAE